jgi:tetratricopeptide (TPR) repeat protein
MSSYLAALRVQPNHWLSWFFLAYHVLHDPKSNRLPEAVLVYTTCIALRPESIIAYMNRAACQLQLGKVDEAAADYTAAIALLRAKFGPDHEDTLECMGSLAAAYREAGRLPEAIALNESTLDNCKAKLGTAHRVTLACMNSLALAYKKAGRLREAIALLEPALEKSKATLGLDNPDTLQITNNLAAAYNEAGRLPEAITLNESTLEKYKAKLGPDHPRTLISMNNLAFAYAEADRLPEAIALGEQALEGAKRAFGPDHENTLITMQVLGRVLVRAGRTEDGLTMLEILVEKRKSSLGPDDEHTLICMSWLGYAYEEVGRLDRAERVYSNLVARWRKKGPKSASFSNAVGLLGGNMLKQKRYAEAEALLRECLAMRADKLVNDWIYFSVQSWMGLALWGQNKHVEAEPLLVQGYEGMRQLESKIPAYAKPRLTEAAAGLVHLYEATNQPEKAKEWRSKLAGCEKAYGPLKHRATKPELLTPPREMP